MFAQAKQKLKCKHGVFSVFNKTDGPAGWPLLKSLRSTIQQMRLKAGIRKWRSDPIQYWSLITSQDPPPNPTRRPQDTLTVRAFSVIDWPRRWCLMNCWWALSSWLPPSSVSWSVTHFKIKAGCFYLNSGPKGWLRFFFLLRHTSSTF